MVDSVVLPRLFFKKKEFVLIVSFLVVVFMLVHVEYILGQEYAPETVLMKFPDGSDVNCEAEIISEQINVKEKPFRKLNSVYDFVDAETFYIMGAHEFYLLETGFDDYRGEFEVNVICFSSDFNRVNYKVINNTNRGCEFKDDGKKYVC
ncbi:hypothetical protein CMI46_00720 [Candidatus Pacearchaeota archaeon]|nr:hypothetical protein [Candidatus Pacearchaeota archaeon]|tara:strand:- start:4013 stop:4459 length:447 start_codon:yes stop_codon:yes gene_type:complete